MAALKFLPRPVALAVLVVGLACPMLAQSEAVAEVGVRTVDFAKVRAPNGGDPWLECVVELTVRPASSGGTYARYADRVRVSLALAVRKRDEGFEFFRSDVELVSLEAGRALVRFYLPPEILEREQVATDPFAYLAEVQIGTASGRGVELSNIREAAALQSFKDRVARFAPANDGILLPQYDSPFVHEYAGDTPTARRRAR